MLECPKCHKQVLYTIYTKESAFEACEECRSVIDKPSPRGFQSLRGQIEKFIDDTRFDKRANGSVIYTSKEISNKVIMMIEKLIDEMIIQEINESTYPDNNSVLTLKQVKEMLK